MHVNIDAIKLMLPDRYMPRVTQGDQSCQDQTLMWTRCLLMSLQGGLASVSQLMQSRAECDCVAVGQHDLIHLPVSPSVINKLEPCSAAGYEGWQL